MPRFHYIAGAGLALLASLGCAGRAPERGTGVEPDRTQSQIVREQPGTPATTPVRASFEYAAGTASYVVTSEVTITEIDSAASEPREFREVARLELTIEPANGSTLVTTTGAVESGGSAAVVHPFVDTLRVGSTESLPEPILPICGRDSVPPSQVGRLLPPVPRDLRSDQRWERRLIYAICQGAIPVRVERTDSFVVVGHPERLSVDQITVARTSAISFAGSGVEGQHNVRISGSGSTGAQLVLQTSRGRLLRSVETSRAEIHVVASGRTRRFSQLVVRRIELAGLER